MTAESKLPHRSDFLILLLANAIWGSTDVVAKFAVAELSPAALVWLRLSIALLAFSPALWRYRSEIPRTGFGLLPLLGAGVCGFFGNFILQYYGLGLAPASHATALRISEASVIFLFSALLLRERIRSRAVLGLLAGTAGVLVVLKIDLAHLDLFASGYRLGDLLIIAGSVVEGFYTIIGKRVLKRTRPILATALACAAGWLLVSISFGPSLAAEMIRRPPSASALLAAAYLGLLATGLGYWMWYRILARRDSHRVGITILIQPLVGIPLAALVFAEPLPASFLLGAALIAAGGYLAISAPEEAKAPENSGAS